MSELAAHLERVAKAAESADWDQVVLNGGPPCFHLYEQGFCLRAKRWAGHANGVAKANRDGCAHEFVSFAEFLAAALAACVLNEAKWWADGMHAKGGGAICKFCERIEALERAAGEKA